MYVYVYEHVYAQSDTFFVTWLINFPVSKLQSQPQSPKARFPFWPPPDASPVTPIEPWGKQFFVRNLGRSNLGPGPVICMDIGIELTKCEHERLKMNL